MADEKDPEVVDQPVPQPYDPLADIPIGAAEETIRVSPRRPAAVPDPDETVKQ